MNKKIKIYFAASIRGGRQDVKLYERIIQILSKFGKVLTEHVGDINLSDSGEVKQDHEIHDRDLGWIDECDVLVAEITVPSSGVGYEIRDAEVKNKPVLCIYRELDGRKVSAMIGGSKKVILKKYQNPEDVEEIFKEFIKNLD